MNINFNQKLRIESSNQYSGDAFLSRIPHLKERHYYILDLYLDGAAPKQYIKAYFYYKNCPRASKPRTWDGYFAKFGGKSYPHESMIEYAINKVGEYLGLKMNETRLVMANEQVRFLSKDFITEGKRLIHGIDILVEYFEDKEFVDELNEKKNRRFFLTFEVIERAIKYVYPEYAHEILNELVKMLTFDAIVGNKDRHFYNWGVIGDVLSTDTKVEFSPIYDSARALLWNKTEESLLSMYRQYRNGSPELDHYINKSKPTFSYENNPKANHFDLLKFITSYNPMYKSVAIPLLTEDKENYVLEKLKAEIYCLFNKERCILMEAILRKRFTKLRSIIYDGSF